jgi:hypothetical protein
MPEIPDFRPVIRADFDMNCRPPLKIFFKEKGFLIILD